MSCKPMSQKTGETGCWILASQPLGAPDSLVYWTIDLFPKRSLQSKPKDHMERSLNHWAKCGSLR